MGVTKGMGGKSHWRPLLATTGFLAVLGSGAAMATSLPGPLIVTDATSSFTIAGVGTNTNQNAVLGWAQGSTVANGVVGTTGGTQSYGVEGIASAGSGTPSFGVVGSSRTGNGGYFYSSNGATAGLFGGNFAGFAPGIQGLSAGAGVLGQSSSFHGVEGTTTANGISAVYGNDLNTASGTFGYGTYGSSQNGYGAYGYSSGSFGVGGAGVVGGIFSGSGGPGAIVGSSGAVSLEVDTSSGSPSTLVDAFDAAANEIFRLDNLGNIFIRGTLNQNALVVSRTRSIQGREVAMYQPREAEPTVEDAGQAQLSNGAAYVRLDPTFASVVNRGTPYLVFITPEGDNRGLYATQKSPTGFAVRESMGGHSTITFDYRIIAKAFDTRGTQRMPEVEKLATPFHATAAKIELPKNSEQSQEKAGAIPTPFNIRTRLVTIKH